MEGRERGMGGKKPVMVGMSIEFETQPKSAPKKKNERVDPGQNELIVIIII